MDRLQIRSGRLTLLDPAFTAPYEIFTKPLAHPYVSERKFFVWGQELPNSHRSRGPLAPAVVSPAELLLG